MEAHVGKEGMHGIKSAVTALLFLRLPHSGCLCPRLALSLISLLYCSFIKLVISCNNNAHLLQTESILMVKIVNAARSDCYSEYITDIKLRAGPNH